MVSMNTMWEREECSLEAVAPTERFCAARAISACSRSCTFTCTGTCAQDTLGDCSTGLNGFNGTRNGLTA